MLLQCLGLHLAASLQLAQAGGRNMSNLAGYRASPFNKTTSASPSPTAAKMKRLSEDHDTRRAMKVGRWPKSVSWRIGTPEVGRAQMFVVGPSLSSRASEFPSGEITGCSNCQEGMREPGMRASTHSRFAHSLLAVAARS